MSSGMIIGLTGLAGCGKSTLADYLVKEHGFERVSFAGPLKKMLLKLNPIIGVSDESPVYLAPLLDGFGEKHANRWTELDVKAEFPEYRRLLQVLGTDCIRALDDDFWVNAAGKQLESFNGKYVFDDCRFPNEAKAIQQGFGWIGKTGTLWNIPREGLVRGEHSSEQWAGKMNENYHLPNDGTTENMFRHADSLIKHLEAIRDAQAND